MSIFLCIREKNSSRVCWAGIALPLAKTPLIFNGSIPRPVDLNRFIWTHFLALYPIREPGLQFVSLMPAADPGLPGFMSYLDLQMDSFYRSGSGFKTQWLRPRPWPTKLHLKQTIIVIDKISWHSRRCSLLQLCGFTFDSYYQSGIKIKFITVCCSVMILIVGSTSCF